MQKYMFSRVNNRAISYCLWPGEKNSDEKTDTRSFPAHLEHMNIASFTYQFTKSLVATWKMEEKVSNVRRKLNKKSNSLKSWHNNNLNPSSLTYQHWKYKVARTTLHLFKSKDSFKKISESFWFLSYCFSTKTYSITSLLLKLNVKFVIIKRLAKTGDKTELLLALLLEDLLEENKVLSSLH